MSSQKHECGVKYFPGFKNYGAPSKGIEKTPGVLVMDLEHIWGLLSFSSVVNYLFSALLSRLWMGIYQLWKAAQRALADALSLQNKAKSLNHVLLLEL